MIEIPVSKDGRTIRLELAKDVFTPSVASTTLLFAVDDKDIKGKRVFDVGIGTGYLGLGLLLRGANYVVGTDINSKAVELAKRNSIINELKSSCEFRQGNMYHPYEPFSSDSSIDIVISNPPLMPKELGRKEYGPHNAIDGCEFGDECILNVIKEGKKILQPEVVLYFPIFSFSNPDYIKKCASMIYKNVKVMARHDIIFDNIKLGQMKIFEKIFQQGKGHPIEHNGHPYWRIEILRCQGVKNVIS